MNNIEELAFRYLSSYFNQDLNESLEQISEEDLRSALIDLNILAVALNEQVAGHDIKTDRYAIDGKINRALVTHALNAAAGKSTKDFSPATVDYKPDEYAIDGKINRALVTHALNAAAGKNTQGFSPATVDYKQEKLSDAGRQNMEKLNALDPDTSPLAVSSPNKQIPPEYLTRAFEKSKRIPAIYARSRQDAEFEKNLPNLAKLGADYEEAKAAKTRPDLTVGRGTPEGERAITDLLSKPTSSARAEAARQSAIASRQKSAQMDVEAGNVTALSDPDRFEYLKSQQGAEATGEIKGTGEKAFTLDDRLGYQVRKAREERDATSKRMLDMQMMREFGTTDPAKMRYEQYGGFAGGVGDGGGSSYGQVSARNGWDRFDLNKRIKDARRSASQQEAIPWNQDLMDRIVARTNTPEAIADRERETQQFDAASRARDEYASSERGQAEIDRRVSAENASRQQRGLPPLNAAAENRLRRSVIADGGRRDQRAAERDARMGLPPVGTPQPQSAPSSEEPYQPATLSTGRPANPANPFGPQVSTPEDRPQPAGTGNTTSVGGGFSIPGQAIPERPFDNNQGYFRGEPYYDGSRRRGRVPDGPEWSEEEERVTEIRDRIDKYNEDPNRGKFGVSGNTTPSWISTPVASALNSRGFRPANPIMNRLRPGGMIA